MGFFRAVGHASVRIILKAGGLFIKAVKSKETKIMIDELRVIDHEVQSKVISTLEVKKRFNHLLLKLEHTLKRLKARGELFEAQHLYHIYERFAQGLDDHQIIQRVKKLHP